MRSLLCGLLFLTAAAAPPPATAQSDALSFRGFVRSYAAARLAPDHEWLGLRARTRLGTGYVTDGGRMYFSLDAMAAYVPPDSAGARATTVFIDEAYAEAYFADVDVRVGKQRIAWGEADGVFVTDIFSPLDLTAFTTQPAADVRQAIPALQVSAYLGDATLSLVGVPAYFPTLLPAPGSPWYDVPNAGVGLPIVVGTGTRPENRVGSGEVGARVQYDGVDLTTLTAIYGYVWNRLPAFRKDLVSISFFGVDIPLRVDVVPVAYRRHVAGITGNTARLDPFILRFEAAYTSRRAFDRVVDVPPSLTDPTVPRDEERLAAFAEAREAGFLAYSPTLDGVIGAERAWGRHLVRLQASGTWIVDDNDQIASDRFSPAFTAFWNARYRRDTITSDVLAFVTPGGTYWVDAGATWSVRDGLNATLGVQLFGGSDDAGAPSALGFGLYDLNDFGYLRVQYDF